MSQLVSQTMSRTVKLLSLSSCRLVGSNSAIGLPYSDDSYSTAIIGTFQADHVEDEMRQPLDR